MNGYDLSRNWFNWCFENPEKIKPNHTALYFFIIEHCNRLGWKEKFGLPTGMTKEAIGIRSYNTFKNTFDDLETWGFINVIERATNQYSSNIIALSNFNKPLDKPNNKSLDKALINHVTKQSESTGQSISSIIKQTNNKQETIKQNTKEVEIIVEDKLKVKTWKNDFETYLSDMNDSFDKIKQDQDFISKQEKFNPNIDIILSIEKSIVNYWATEAGWSNKKKTKTQTINWKSTFANAISMNKVYKNTSNNGSNQSRQQQAYDLLADRIGRTIGNTKSAP